MSGFFGIVNRNGKSIDPNYANIMLDAMSDWGPDECHICIKDTIAFGHTMLWNTPESKYEHLPLEKDIYILTMDARIDNRDELVKELDLPDHPIEEIGDSEFILAAYVKWGKESPKYLLGDFSFAIWDKKQEQLFCVRDHVGIKPFYYELRDDIVVFSNDLETMMSYPHISKELDDEIVATFLKTEGIYTNRSTFFRKIKKLPPATTLCISASEVEESVYWRIEESPSIKFDTYEEYIRELRKLYDAAVEARLRTKYQVASHLSGGIDSSPIAVLAAKKLKKRNQNLHVFNWIDVPDTNEKYEYEAWSFSREISNTMDNIIHNEFSIDENFWVEKWHKHNIFTKGTMYYWQEYYVQDAIENLDARTLLSGWGGDELISYNGYSYISGLISQWKIFEVIKHLFLNKDCLQVYSFKVFMKKTLKVILPSKVIELLRKLKKNEDITKRYTKYMLPKFSEFAKIHKSKKLYNARGVRKRQLTMFYHGHLQERIESWHLSNFSKKFEYRYPLLDKRIIEFAIGIPEELFYPHRCKERYLIKNALSDLLPSEILWFSKADETKINNTNKETYIKALKLIQKQHKEGLFKYRMNNYLDAEKIESAIDNFNFDTRDVFELGNVEAVILFMKAKGDIDYNL